MIVSDLFPVSEKTIGQASNSLSVSANDDLNRLYAAMFSLAGAERPIGSDQWPLILAGMVSAFAGVVIGKRFMHKITMKTIPTLTGSRLLVIAVALGSGII